METEKELNLRIVSLTQQIQEQYPELYRNLDEMHATLPSSSSPAINTLTLGKWYNTLQVLVLQYKEATCSSMSGQASFKPPAKRRTIF
jgi:hypothetical protein